MNSWTGDVDESEEESDDDEDDGEEFHKQFEVAILGTGSSTDISELELINNIEEVDDENLLREAWLAFDGEKRNIVENRLEDLGVNMDSEDGDDSDKSDETSESDESDESDEIEESDEQDEASGWGDSSDDPEPEVESMEDMEDESPSAADGADESNEESESEQSSSGPPTPEYGMSVEEAADLQRRWKFLVWGPPKLFKTHMAFTMPEPIAFLDLEGKADDLAGKFTDKEVQIWQPKEMSAEPDTKFRRAKKALDEAFEWLDWYRENEGKVGTIVVDSMSLMWEWAQVHHKIENYPVTDNEDIELSANFKSSQESDWAIVKEYHNSEFRERITDSDYHFYWTAMQRVQFEQTFEEDSNIQIMEPVGEPKNDYKADTVIHARNDKDDGKVGDLTGSNYVDNKFVGLQKPTFQKVIDAVELIEEAEVEGGVSRSDLADKINAQAVIEGDPQRFLKQ